MQSQGERIRVKFPDVTADGWREGHIAQVQGSSTKVEYLDDDGMPREIWVRSDLLEVEAPPPVIAPDDEQLHEQLAEEKVNADD